MICLIRPPATESFRFATTSLSLPIGLAYIAGALEHAGHRVGVIDAVGEAPTCKTAYLTGYLVGLPLNQVVERIPGDATFVGISVIFTHEWPAAVRLIELIKTRYPHLPVVLGGEHVTAMPEFCLLTSAADVVITGEGEETVVEYARALEAGQDPGRLPGVVCRDGASIVVNPRRPRILNVDTIPWPAWQHFKVDTYHHHRFVDGIYSSALTIPILATRGCPYQCTYCSSPNMWTPKWLPREPARVVDEIEHYVKKFGARNFPFHDLTAIIKKDWIVEFCQELLRRHLDITWQLPSGTRSEAVDGEVAALLSRTGMISMAYAPESGSETTRKYVKKQMKTEKLFASIEAAAKADLNVSIFTVIGFPHDTDEHLSENLRFIDQLVDAGVTDFTVGYYMGIPGTELFNHLCDTGKITIDRNFFAHMLSNTALVPQTSYCENFDRLQLTAWKLRLLLRFYCGKNRLGVGGLSAALLRALRGLVGGGHRTKLETAFRNGLQGAFNMLTTRLSKRWIPARDEERMMAGWDAVHRSIRQTKSPRSPAPTPPEELHRINVMHTLRPEHEEARRIWIPAP